MVRGVLLWLTGGCRYQSCIDDCTNVMDGICQCVHEQMLLRLAGLNLMWGITPCVCVRTAPAPSLSPRLLLPPPKDVPSTPAKRRKRRQRRDTTKPTPSSTRTPSCRVACGGSRDIHALHMQSIYTHAIPSCPAQVSCWRWTTPASLILRRRKQTFVLPHGI